jgi:DNA-binding MarR family transcriptional regulator
MVAGTIIRMDDAVKPKGCTQLKLRQLGRVVTRHYDAYVGATGLKNTQYSLLSNVVLLGPVRPSDLARRMSLDASTLNRNLQPLVAQGWVRVGPGTDARSRLVQATAAGRAKRLEGQRAWKQAQLALNERLGPDCVVALHALLDDCMGRLAPLEGAREGEAPDVDAPVRRLPDRALSR